MEFLNYDKISLGLDIATSFSIIVAVLIFVLQQILQNRDTKKTNLKEADKDRNIQLEKIKDEYQSKIYSEIDKLTSKLDQHKKEIVINLLKTEHPKDVDEVIDILDNGMTISQKIGFEVLIVFLPKMLTLYKYYDLDYSKLEKRSKLFIDDMNKYQKNLQKMIKGIHAKKDDLPLETIKGAAISYLLGTENSTSDLHSLSDLVNIYIDDIFTELKSERHNKIKH